MNKERFYDVIRNYLFGGQLKQTQVDGIEMFLNAGVEDERHLAYILATVYHETAKTFQPIEEYGKGKGKRYGEIIEETGKVYYGRGYVQITWASNYSKFSKILGVDLYRNPELALNPDIALKIALIGMEKGLFTGKKLDDYFNETKTDWINARRIINGLDSSEKIAILGKTFYQALS